MYTPSALIMPMPARAHTARISANTPNGAAHSTQRTITIIASAIAWKKSTSLARWSPPMRVSAKPKNSANTTSGSIALSAAAAIALLGTIATRESAQLAGWVAAAAPVPAALCRAAARSGSRGTSASSAIQTQSCAVLRIKAATTRAAIARRPPRPVAAASAAVLTPTITNASTSGTTVICSALSQSLPKGCTASATRVAWTGSNAASSRPTAAPSSRAISTRAGVDRRARTRGAASVMGILGVLVVEAAADWISRTGRSRSTGRAEPWNRDPASGAAVAGPGWTHRGGHAILPLAPRRLRPAHVAAAQSSSRERTCSR